MKLTAILLLIGCLHVSANSFSQQITLQEKNISIEKVFKEIKKQTGYLFLYTKEVVQKARKVDINVHNASLEEVLKQCFTDQPVTYSIVEKTIIIKPGEETPVRVAVAEPISGDLTGRVVDSAGVPLQSASVTIKGTPFGAATNINGEFTIFNVPAGNYTLEISIIGFERQERKITIGNEPVNLSFSLKRSVTINEETVVIGYGTSTRRQLTGSVSSVTSKDIHNLNATTFDQMLQGLASGVLVSNSSGAPGKPTSVTIRGRNSINSGDPLYVVDGTPVISGSFGSVFGVDNTLNAFVGLNPDDIASIDILKDAGTTAIYGSRAANGVVMITTKRGRDGQTTINLNAFQGVGIPTGRLNLLQTKDYIALRREGFLNDNPGQPFPADLAKPDSITNTNWQDLIYKPTSIGEYKLNISGGNGITQFYMSGSYRRETNPLSGKKGLERGTFRINLDHQAGKRLTISASLGASRDVNQNTAGSNTSYSPTDAALLAAPNLKPYDSAGNFTLVPLPNGVGNPLAIFNIKLNDATTQLKGSLQLNYLIAKGLSFHTDLGYDFNQLAAQVYLPKAVNAVLQNPLFDASVFNAQVNTFSVEPQLRYNKNWKSIHQVEAVAGTTFQKTLSVGSNIYGKGFPSDDLQQLSAAATTQGSSFRSQYAFNSVFGRVNYTYRSNYIASGTFRRDGSSRFGPGNRFGNFWSLSGGWIFSREKFMRGLRFLSLGKLRTSYGIVGSDAIPDFTYVDQWQPWAYGNQPGVRPITAENPFVKWEQTGKFDVGVDLGFVHQKINLTFNYFSNRTDNMLVTRTLPSQTGFASIQDNLPAVVKNKGWEIELSTINVRTDRFQWTTKFNLTREKNILTSFPGLDNISFYNLNYRVGESLNLLWGYKFLGVDPATGIPMYDGFNQDGTLKKPADPFAGREIIGRFSPDYYGGLINNFSWKGFSLDVFLQFVKGSEKKDAYSTLNNSAVYPSNQEVSALQRWQKAGDITNTPRAATTATAWWITSGVDDQSSRFLSDGSYCRVKNVTLAYTFPASVTGRLNLKLLRVFASAQNAATITRYKGIDPETGGNVALPKMITGGVNITF